MDLDALLKPRSIAIVGASERPSIGRTLIEASKAIGYQGALLPINPKYPAIQGLPCYPSLADLPQAPDLVLFCVASRRVLEGFEMLPAAGARAAVVYDAGFAESGAEGRAVQDRIDAICREAGIALCGPNCMGNMNPHHRSTSYIMPIRDAAQLAGNVGVISHSGSISIGLLGDMRRFGYSLMISSGNEAVVKTGEYLDYLVDDPNTKVIATFTEAVRDPERFIAALDRAADAGKPVVVLKVGRSERARHAITSHTGGLAGSTRVFSELLRRHRAIEVSDMDELTEVLAVCQGARWPKGRRIAVVTASGGQAELVLDVSEAAGLQLPALAPAERAAIEATVGPLTGDGNPTDAWGNGDFATNLPAALKVLGASPGLDAIAFCSDVQDGQPLGDPAQMSDFCKLLIKASKASDKPHYEMNMRPGLMHAHHVALLRQAGLAMIGGTRQGLGAVDRLARWTTAQRRPRKPALYGGPTLAQALGDPSRRTVNEHDAKRILAARGVPVARERLVRSLDEAVAAAAAIGWPVVLKAVSDDLPHKTEYGLVQVGLADAGALRAAWSTLQDRLKAVPAGTRLAGFLVQEMVAEGIEVFAGVSRDPDFGLSLAFGIGGVAIEVTRDFALRMLPLQEGDAEAMIGEIRGAALLGPLRGRPAADVESLAACLYALGDFAAAESRLVREIDLNPIKVLPAGRGCRVVDALIVLDGAPAQAKGASHA